MNQCSFDMLCRPEYIKIAAAQHFRLRSGKLYVPSR